MQEDNEVRNLGDGIRIPQVGEEWPLVCSLIRAAVQLRGDHHGHLRTGWALVMIALGLLVVAASVYLVYVLEILKFRRLDASRLRRSTAFWML